MWAVRPAQFLPNTHHPVSESHDVTRLLHSIQSGDKKAVDLLIAHVHGELRLLADAYLRGERTDHTLQPTALVNEVYIKLVGQRHVRWQSRSHFLGIAAQAMRRILVDHARRRGAAKRSGGQNITLDEGMLVERSATLDIIAVNDALSRLGELDGRQSRIVELRFFGGLEIEEIAEVMGVSPATVKREWRTARAWLRRELADDAQ
jgi:RNA polymerase sigma factor (TIGR02999 family)